MKLYVVVVEGNYRYGEEVVGVFTNYESAQYQINCLDNVDHLASRDIYIDELELDKLNYI